MAPIYLTTVIGLLVTSTILVSGASLRERRSNRPPRVYPNLLGQVTRQEQTNTHSHNEKMNGEELASIMRRRILLPSKVEKAREQKYNEEALASIMRHIIRFLNDEKAREQKYIEQSDQMTTQRRMQELANKQEPVFGGRDDEEANALIMKILVNELLRKEQTMRQEDGLEKLASESE